MSKFIVTIFLVFVGLSNIYGQTKRMENKYMDCFYHTYGEESINNYEKLLVDEGVLEDNSGKSYMIFLRNFAERNKSVKRPSKLFCLEIKKLEKPEADKFRECQKTMLLGFIDYDMSKFFGVEEGILNKARPYLVARAMLKIVSEDDLEIDYYKFMTFLLFCVIDTESGVMDKEEESYDLTNALKITLNSESEIFVNDEKVTIKELKKRVRKYELKHKSESVISFSVEGKTKYAVFVVVKDAIFSEIHYLREELAMEKYNLKLDILNEEELGEVKRIYPLRIAE